MKDNLSMGILSVLLSEPHRVISPKRGIAIFAKYAMNTARIVFFLLGLYPNGSISNTHLKALLINPKIANKTERPTQ